jgi:predicted anti-sigma-YlaC factor YlaD
MTTHYDRETLIDYLHRELAPEADADVFEHLEACAACRALHDEEASFGEALRSFVQTTELELPSMVKARVWDRVRNERPSWVARLRAWGPMIAVPVAAAVALAAYLGTPVLHQRSSVTGIEAAYFLDEHNAQAQQNPLGPGAAPAVYAADTAGSSAPAASYIDTADAATLDSADGAVR